MRVIFHREVHEEMIESARYYEGRAEGLGSDFLSAVEETTRRIEQSPRTGPIERATIRKRLVSGFPFTVLLRDSARSNIHRGCDASTSSPGLLAKTSRIIRSVYLAPQFCTDH